MSGSILTVGELVTHLLQFDPQLPILKSEFYSRGYNQVSVNGSMLWKVKPCPDPGEMDFLDAEIGETGFHAVVL